MVSITFNDSILNGKMVENISFASNNIFNKNKYHIASSEEYINSEVYQYIR